MVPFYFGCKVLIVILNILCAKKMRPYLREAHETDSICTQTSHACVIQCLKPGWNDVLSYGCVQVTPIVEYKMLTQWIRQVVTELIIGRQKVTA